MTALARGSTLNSLSILSTVIDAARSFRRGDPLGGAFLLGAAALSRKVPGLGVIASLVVRVLRRGR